MQFSRRFFSSKPAHSFITTPIFYVNAGIHYTYANRIVAMKIAMKMQKLWFWGSKFHWTPHPWGPSSPPHRAPVHGSVG